MYFFVVFGFKLGEVVVDMVVVFGGKIFYMVQLMENGGIIYVFDVGEDRLREMRFNLLRLGVINIIFFYSLLFYIDEFGVEFDKIFFDVFCIGFGIIYKNFERKVNRIMEDVKFCQGFQMKFFEKGLSVLKKGGVLVYFICFFELEENEFVI